MLSEPTIAEVRVEKRQTLDEFASAIGLKSRGYASAIEAGGPCSVKVALEVERWSDGRIRASSLNPDVARVESARADECERCNRLRLNAQAAEHVQADNQDRGGGAGVFPARQSFLTRFLRRLSGTAQGDVAHGANGFRGAAEKGPGGDEERILS